VCSSDLTGIGIENTKRRLALQFGDHAEFSLQQMKESVIAQLIFKIKDN
jgi:sensor histidine kinase YesM